MIRNMKNIIVFNSKETNQPRVEDLRRKLSSKSIFTDAYKSFLKQLNSYLDIVGKDSSKDSCKYNKYESENNIFAFIGPRGSGKTSCMLSTTKMLCERSYEDSIDEKFSSVEKYKFVCLDLIDPYYQDKKNSILSLVVSSLYNSCDEHLKSNRQIGKPMGSNRRELICSFQSVYHALNLIVNDTPSNPGVESLTQLLDLSSAIELKKHMKDLIDQYLEYIGEGKDSKLIIQIDDMDLHVGKSVEMIEQVRRYLTLPNVVVLVSLRMEQMELLKHQELEQNFKLREISDTEVVESCKKEIDEMVERYFVKAVPYSHRIYMPSVEDYLDFDVMLKEDENETNDEDETKQPNEPLYQLIPKLIFKKTRYLFLNEDHASYIVPRNLRELRQLIDLLIRMEDFVDNSNLSNKIIYQQQVFKKYLFGDWCQNNLTPQLRRIITDLANTKEPELLNKRVVDALRKPYMLDTIEIKSVKDIFNPRNKYNQTSIGDVIGLIRYLEGVHVQEQDRKFFFLLKALYSIRLYDYYNIIKQGNQPIKGSAYDKLIHRRFLNTALMSGATTENQESPFHFTFTNESLEGLRKKKESEKGDEKKDYELLYYIVDWCTDDISVNGNLRDTSKSKIFDIGVFFYNFS